MFERGDHEFSREVALLSIARLVGHEHERRGDLRFRVIHGRE